MDTNVAGLLPAFAATSRPVRVMSFGGGVQSVTIAAMQVLGLIEPYDVYLWANVGDDSETDETLDYVRNVFAPWAKANGIEFHEICKTKRDGTPAPTLLETVMGDNRTIPLPIWMSGGAPGRRTCTTDWKIRPINKWIKQHGYTHAIVGIGFSCDESERAKPEKVKWHDVEGMNAKKPKKLGFWMKQEYPLLTTGVYRDQCTAILARVGLPVPPKSACKYCPFSSLTRLILMKRNKPEEFKIVCGIEKRVNEKRAMLGMDIVTIHPGGQMLEVAVPDYLPMFDFEDGGGCGLGHCNT